MGRHASTRPETSGQRNELPQLSTLSSEVTLSACEGATTIAAFVYDGDGVRVKGTVNGVTTAYVGEILEWTGSTSTMVKYYYAGGTRVAMRNGTTLYWLIGDHLSSTSVVATSSGGLHSKMLYKSWGEVRYASASLPTRYTYTGQYSYMDDPGTPGVTEGFGLMFYRSRWYDPLLSRFAQADSIIPVESQGVQAWDRYAGMNNNPVRYNDPTGHCAILCTALVGGLISAGVNYVSQVTKNLYQGKDFASAATNVDLKSIGISFVGGAVAGATMGIVNPLVANIITDTLAAGISGGIANAAAGQTEALAEASINQMSDIVSGEDFDSYEFVQDAHDSGFMNFGNIIEDGIIGGTLSAAGYQILRPILGPSRIPIKDPMFFDDIYYKSQRYLVGVFAAGIKTTSDIVQDVFEQTLDDWDNQWLGPY